MSLEPLKQPENKVSKAVKKAVSTLGIDKVFDIETNGFLLEMDIIHCINVINIKTQERLRFNDHHVSANGSVEDGVKYLMSGVIAGHNIHNFDIPAIKKIFPYFKTEKQSVDTLPLSQLIWNNLAEKDWAAFRKGKLPQKFKSRGLLGLHKLEAWGYRLGDYKGDFDPADYGHTWATVPFSVDMDDYCMQDVELNYKLIQLMERKNYSSLAIELETKCSVIVARQQAYGFLFDKTKAEELLHLLSSRRAEMFDECATVFAPWYKPDGAHKTEFIEAIGKEKTARGLRVPKRTQKRKGVQYIKGAPYIALKLTVFNPNSRDHIADRLQKLFGWRPVDFTPSGKPKVDESILKSLTFPKVEVLKEYMTIQKRLGQLSEGKQAWLDKIGDDKRIHGRVSTNGALTGRMTHSSPNVAQTPASKSLYGKECRELFTVPEGKKLVGCDAEGLELRGLAERMFKYDGGVYARAVIHGKSKDGTDAHTINQKAIGLNSRDNAKTWFYAFIYGAGAFTLGLTVLEDMTDEKRRQFFDRYPAGDDRDKAIVRLGSSSKRRLKKSLPALEKVIEEKEAEVDFRGGYLLGADKRRLPIRKMHAILNTDLQSLGAVIMKLAMVILDDELIELGFKNSSNCNLPEEVNYEFVANVHDEWQIETDEDIAETVGKVAADAIRKAGEQLNLKCALAGSYDVGNNWAETH